MRNITDDDMRRLADTISNSCLNAGDLEVSKSLRRLVHDLRATFPLPDDSWRAKCHILPSNWNHVEKYWRGVYSPDKTHHLNTDGEWETPTIVGEFTEFRTESAARAALASAPPPPGVSPCNSSSVSGAASSGTHGQTHVQPPSTHAHPDLLMPDASAQGAELPTFSSAAVAGDDGMEERLAKSSILCSGVGICVFARSEVARATASNEATIRALTKECQRLTVANDAARKALQ